MWKPTKTLLGFALALSALAGFVRPVHAQQAGTTLTASKTAEGFYERQVDYDWTIQKSASPSSLTINQGQDGTITYRLDANRTVTSDTTVAGVRGEVCVTNGGDRPTENLTITDVIQTKTGSGPFTDWLSTPVDMSANPVLDAGESHCYPYEIEFTPQAGAQYRNEARVTITNHSGYLPGGNQCEVGQVCPFGPEPKASFSVPAEPTLVETDETAQLDDIMTCPTGFTCTRNPNTSSWTLMGPMSISYTVNVHNTSATCNENVQLTNIASLTELDTSTVHTATAVVNIYTGACTGGGNVACTNTIGYWKTHAGFGPQADVVTPLLAQHLGTPGGAKTLTVTSAPMAVSVLNMNVYGTQSNGITKLYAQLLGAKLSIARGASNTAVATVIAQADAFLATRNHTDWKSLSKAQQNQVLSWQAALDAYNNGVTGPGHCN